jgi:Tfp pilus assembly protein PilO
MTEIRPDRLWALGGVLTAVALCVAGWFLLINPQHEQAESLRGQADAAGIRLITLQRRLTDLRKQSSDVDRYRAELERDRQALPTTPDLADFLRELQTAGTGTGVSVSGVIVGSANSVPVGSGQISSLPVTLTASGAVAKLGTFLDQLQQVQPRAVLVTGVSVVPEGQSASFTGTVTLTLTMQIFVASS